MRLLDFTGPAVGLYVILQGCLLSLTAYVGGYSIYLIASQVLNRALASNLTTGQMLCKITLEHSLIAMALTTVVAILVASIGAYRAINIEPAQSLREL
nr:hypothetical protein [Candidatus Symbiopectobacterium sp. PLON1]